MFPFFTENKKRRDKKVYYTFVFGGGDTDYDIY